MQERHEIFPVTDWSRLKKLKPIDGTDGAADKQTILGELYLRYKSPILVYLARKGLPPASQEDTVQDFFLYSMEQGLFEKADPARGRFRNLMLTALNHYTAHTYRRDQAAKRRPEGGLVSVDEMREESGELQIPGGGPTPEQAFDHAWAQALIMRVIASLKNEYLPAKQLHYEIFQRCVLNPVFSGSDAPSYKELATEFSLTEKEVSNRLVTARRAYERLLREEIESYAGSKAEVDEEIREIFRALSQRS